MIIIISGGWIRWFYALWILKRIEELGLKKEVKAIFGVSIWAVVWALWLSWHSADQIYEKAMKINIYKSSKLNLLHRQSLFKSTFFRKFLKNNLPNNFEDLEKKLFVWTTDIKNHEYMLYSEWDLISPLLGSCSLPWIFPAVSFENKLLVDWWVINNFPANFAKELFPNEKLIWIALNKLDKDKPIKNMFSVIRRSISLLIKENSVKHYELVDYLFHQKLSIKIIDTRKKEMKRVFEKWYQDSKEYFG